MSLALTNEIVKRIFSNIGVLPLRKIGSAGVAHDNFVIDKVIRAKYGDKEVKHKVYSSEMPLKQTAIRSILVDLTAEDIPEFIFVFRMGENPIHSIRLIFDEDGDESFIKFFNEKTDIWIDTNIYMQSIVLGGFETIVSLGVLWAVKLISTI
jgi:hypothetical protein